MLPKQKLSSAEKKARDPVTGKDWAETTADYYIDQFQFSAEHTEMIRLRQAVDGIIHQGDYDYVLNPFNVKDSKNLRYGARLRDYNIIKGIINLLMGEFGRRSHEYTVTDFNPTEENSYKEQLRIATKGYYSQLAVNSLNQQGFQTGKQSQELPNYEEFVQEFKRTFDENRVLTGQEALDYIRFEQEIDDKILNLYWDWLIVGRAISYKTVRHDDVDYEYVPAEEYYFPLEYHSMYVEDFSFGIRRRIMQINHIVDVFRGKLDSADLEKLEMRRNSGLTHLPISSSVQTQQRGFIRLETVDDNCADDYFTPTELNYGVEVFHVVWKAFRQVGLLRYIDKLGQINEKEVDDTYVLNEEAGDIDIEWEWINENWEVWKIDKDIYVDKRPIPYERSEVNNDSVQKLPYNGIMMRSQNGSIQSIAKQGVPYQLLVNGLHFQLEKVVNKNKDKITVLPYGLIPRKKGISTKDAMYHADSTSILWIDETAPNAQFAAQMIKVLDMSLGQYIKDIIEIMRYIKSEYWEEIGMNPQRYASIDQGAGKGTTEQAIVRSAIITYELTRRMDKFIERDYKACLDLSKYAWLKGKKKDYVRSDGSKAFIDLSLDDAQQHLETDYGVFVRDSQELTDSLKAYKSLALTFAQNEGSMEAVGELLSNTNMERIKGIVRKIEEHNKLYQQQISEAEQAHKERIAQLESENKALDRKLKKYEIDKDYDKTVESAKIRANASRAQVAKPDSPTEIELASHKINKENKELDLQQQEINNNKLKTQDDGRK